MTTLIEFLSELRRLDIRLSADGGQLRISAPDGVLTTELRKTLQERKEEILDFLGSAGGTQSAALIPPVARGPNLPLSFAQQQMWLLDQLNPGTHGYNMPAVVRLRGTLDTLVLERSLNSIVERHETLRTTFVSSAVGQPFQEIAASLTIPIPLVDLYDVAPADCQARAMELATQEIQTPFDLGRGALVRALLVRLDETEHILVLTLHHIISDGWAMGVLVSELTALYRAYVTNQPAPLPPLSIQYADFAVWQRQEFENGGFDPQMAYWQQQLAGLEESASLPADRPRRSGQPMRGGCLTFTYPPALTKKLKNLSHENGVTLFATLLTGFNVLLQRYSGLDDISVGTFSANRNRPQIETLIGVFINTLVLRANLQGNPTFQNLLKQIHVMTAQANAHQDLPFDKLAESLHAGLGRQKTLFRSMFVLQNTPFPTIQLPGLSIEWLRPQRNDSTPNTDLDLFFEETPEGLLGIAEYNADLFEPATILRMVAHLQNLLEAAADGPQRRIAELPILTETERQQLLLDWNATQSAYPREKCLQQLIEEQVERSPEAIAISFGEQQISYRELNRRANQLARRLQSLGVKPGVFVGVCMERSLEMIVGLLGILKAGGAYIPLDPNYPSERLSYMLGNAAPRVLLTQDCLRERLPEQSGPLLCLDSDWPAIARESDANPASGATPEDPLYAIYTSGSTGQPKGAVVCQRGFVNLLHWFVSEFGLTAQDSVLLISSSSFDLTQKNLYAPLIVGGTLYLPASEQYDAREIVRLVTEYGVTWLNCTPSAFYPLVDDTDQSLRMKETLRYVFLGGETIAPARFAAWLKAPGGTTEIINTYGPTECTDISNFHRLDPATQSAETNIPVGKPIANVQVYVLDAHLELVPPGVTGELFIGGESVGYGYLNNPELTAEKFVPNPFAAAATVDRGPGTEESIRPPSSVLRLYRTGDLARWQPDGNIVFLGRSDHQVKVRGFRIELGEIEAALDGHPAVRESVVVAREEPEGARQRLVAYVVPNEGQEIPVPELRRKLREQLPEYMVPAIIMPLQSLPLSPNGKVDRKALPVPEGAQPGIAENYVAPRNPLEETLARLWAEVLGVERVGIHDNFFELGGHSLLAITLIELMRRAGLSADARTLFATPTIAALAVAVNAGGDEVEVPPNRIPEDCQSITPDMLPLIRLSVDEIAGIVKAVPGGAANIQDIYPLAPLQEGILFHHLMSQTGDAYLLPSLIGFDSRERLERFVSALQTVINRHDILRTSVLWDGISQPVQVLWRQAPVVIEEVSFDGEDIARQLTTYYSPRHTRVDVRAAPMLRGFAAEDRAHNRWLLQILSHHLAGDHTTMELLIAEIQAILQGRAEDLPATFPFRNFVAQAKLGIPQSEHEAFFTEMLSGVDEPTAPFGLLDVQGDGSDIQEARQRIDLGLSRRLRQQARRLGVSAASLIHLAWAQVLSRITGRQDVVFGTILFGRMQGGAGADRVLGMFINTLPVCISVGNVSVQESVRQTHARLTQLLRHEHAPLALAQRCSGVQAPAPLFSTLLNYVYNPGAETPAQVWDGIQMLGAEERTNYPVGLSVDDLGEAFELIAQVDVTIQAMRICDYMHTTLENLVGALETAPQTPANQIEILPLSDRNQLLIEWNATATEYPRECIHELFEEQAEKTPEAVAVIFENQSLTYAELNARSNQLAYHLRSQGVRPDTLVGICVERSPEMIVGLLGILKAGGAYVPLDPSYPAERLAYMFEDARPTVLLTQQHLQHGLPIQGFCIDSQWETLSSYCRNNPENITLPGNLAYVIYTSGSTGRPKGTLLHHSGLSNLVRAQVDAFSVHDGQRVLQFASFNFDASTSEIFMALTCGATLCLAAREDLMPGETLDNTLEQLGINVATLPPVALNTISGSLPDLETIIVAGEACPASLVAQWADNRQFFNAYGPTETTVCATIQHCQVEQAGAPPIGRPIANTQVYILDKHLNPVPVGVPGELYIAGDGLARGYLNRPDLTAEKFIPNPFAATAVTEDGGPRTEGSICLSSSVLRLYRTGDLSRYLPNGAIEYLGRIDNQVKIRGFRIELGEIEAALAALPEVHDAIVLAREDTTDTSLTETDKRLVAYLVVHAGYTLPETAAIRNKLAQSLPDYMLPAYFIQLDQLPLTPNGKVDRKALPAPDMIRSEADYVAPRNLVEEQLAQIWAEVLKLDKVGIHDNFFELGGHSLLATQVTSRIRQALDTELSMRGFFLAPTVAELAEAIQQNEKKETLPILLVPRTEELPLSFAQQRLWFLDQFEPGSALYNIPGAVRLTGKLNEAALLHALNEIARRHEALRTRFSAVDGAPRQVIAEHFELALPVTDLTELPAPARETRARKLAQAEAQTPFDLASGPLIRVGLIRLDVTDHIVLFTLHHIVSDGWSMGVLVNEVAVLYSAYVQNGISPLPELPIQYADFAHWQRYWLSGHVLQQQLNYWIEQLSGSPTLLTLPTDRPRPVEPSHRGAMQSFEISVQTTAGLYALSKQNNTTLFMTLTAAFNVLLSRYSSQSDICIGAPIANRNRAEIEALIGFFVNTLVLRTRVDNTASFDNLLQQVRATTLSAYAHQDVPFEQLVDILKPERHTSHSPLFQVMLALQNVPMQSLELPGLKLQPVATESATAKFDLTLNVTESDGQLFASFEYSTDLFDQGTIERMSGHFTRLLEGVVANPGGRIQDLPMLGAEELHQLLVEWNATATEYPHEKCIHELFEAPVEKNSEAVAVVFENKSLTYAELNARSNQLAHSLRSQGVGPDILVGICLERSLEMVVGLLGILKAGGAYVPLDPTYPRERLAFMLTDSNLKILLTQNSLIDSLPEHTARPILIDSGWPAIATEDTANLPRNTNPDHLAYIIYTSGSTGRPKGVQITHRAVVNFLSAMRREPGLTEHDRLLSVTTLSFDIAGLELYLPLTGGAVVEITPREIAADGFRLRERLNASRATVMQATPATWRLLLEAGWHENEPVKVLCGGEALPSALARDLLPRATSLWNLYGPTETTVWSALARVQTIAPDGTSIGRPIANTQIYILDARLNPTPVGVPGELHIAGDGLAHGYLNRPDLTAERFIPNPFSGTSGARMYKTGDLARYLPDGNIEYLGRIDNQVKVRGFRIELGEIESAISRHSAIRQAAVLVHEDTENNKQLLAYVVSDESVSPSIEQLRSHLKTYLPDYMFPSGFVFLKEFPLTPNGKVDRKALPAPDLERSALTHEYTAPRTPAEEMLASIWANVLKCEQVGVHDNFFELGGHSLLATQLISRMRQAFDVELSLRELFQSPTVAELAQTIQSAKKVQSGRFAPISRPEEIPLSFEQQRLWLVDQLDPGTPLNNMFTSMRIHGLLDATAFKCTFQYIVRRHESLHTYFRSVDGGRPRLVIDPDMPVNLLLTDLSECELAEQEVEVQRLTREAVLYPFDLAKGPLLRCHVLRLAYDEHIMLLSIHHSIMDGWSMGILIQEVAIVYQAFVMGQPSPLPELTLQYADYILWERNRLESDALKNQMDYWKKQLAGLPDTLDLPTDYPRPARQSGMGSQQLVNLSQELSAAAQNISRQEDVTLYMTLLAVLQALLACYSGQTDIVVGSPIANRSQTEFEDTIGFFINTLLLRTDLSGDPTFRELLQRVRKTCLNAFEHPEIPYKKIIDDLQVTQNLSHNPLFQTLFVLQDARFSGSSQFSGDLSLENLPTDIHTAQFDVYLTLQETTSGVSGYFVYDTGLFEQETMIMLTNLYCQILDAWVTNPEQHLSELRLPEALAIKAEAYRGMRAGYRHNR